MLIDQSIFNVFKESILILLKFLKIVEYSWVLWGVKNMKTNVIFTCAILVLIATIILIPAADAIKESSVNPSELQSTIHERATERANVTVTGSGKNPVQNSSDSSLLSSLSGSDRRTDCLSIRPGVSIIIFSL